jgi:hypothetical protein
MIENNNYKKHKTENSKNEHPHKSKNEYFCISKIVIIWENGDPVGYSFGGERKVYNKEILKHTFREKVCNGCIKVKSSNEFYWKIKGFEGPFESLWGTRQPKCITCEKNSKKTQYKKRVKKLKRVTNVVFGFNTSEVFLNGNDKSQELAKLILDFSIEVINGTDK